MTIKCNGQKVA